MGIPTIDYDSSLELVLDELAYTRARLKAHPLTAALAADFDAFQPKWMAVFTQEIGLRAERQDAAARVIAADDDLDDLSDGLSKALLIITKGNRGDPLYKLYYGDKRPSDLKRPTLGPQLETMRGWTPSLVASPHAMLTDYGTQLQDKVGVADDAVATAASAEQKSRAFRTVGERKALIDDFNALRKATYGKLAEMPHTQPAAKLPASFADRFFRHGTWTPPEKPATSAELAAEIAAKQAEVEALQAELAKTKADEDADAQAKAQAEADAEALAAAQRAADDAAAKVAELKAKLGKR